MPEPLQDEELPEDSQFQALGGDPVLNWLNTVTLIDGKLVDSLKNGNDVLAWLNRSGWPSTKGPRPSLPPRLLKTARALRREIRELVEKRKAGKRLSLETLNAFLRGAESHLQLEPGSDRTLTVTRNWKERTAEQVLGPLAEAAAELLAEGDFSLIRRCENRKCPLWFYDRTRGHRRRWCSMAACGNRAKVKAFRRRQWHKSLSGRS